MNFLSLSLPGAPGESVDIYDPLAHPSGGAGKIDGDATLGTIITQLMPYIMGFSALILFAMLIAGGFTLLTAAGNPEGIKKGQGLITSAVIGFVVIFAAFWIMQIIQAMFGVSFGFGT